MAIIPIPLIANKRRDAAGIGAVRLFWLRTQLRRKATRDQRSKPPICLNDGIRAAGSWAVGSQICVLSQPASRRVPTSERSGAPPLPNSRKRWQKTHPSATNTLLPRPAHAADATIAQPTRASPTRRIMVVHYTQRFAGRKGRLDNTFGRRSIFIGFFSVLQITRRAEGNV